MKSKFFRNTTVLITVLAIFFQYDDCRAQYYEITLEKKVQKSEIIVEGEVIESTSYESGGRIYTCHKLNVLNWVYPQNSPCSTSISDEETECFYVLTNGGRLSDRTEHWAHSVQLNMGATGLFLLSDTQKPVLYTDAPSYDVYSGYQGFIRYTLDEDVNFLGSEIFNQYQDPDTELIDSIYNILQVLTSKPSFIRDEWELYFSIYNIVLVNTTVTFDVGIKAKWGNKFKIKDLSTRFKYDTSIFGSNALTNGDLSFTIDSGLSQDGVSLSASQLFTDEVKLDFVDGSASDGNYIGESYQKLMSVEIELQSLNFNELPYFEFVVDANDQTLVNEGSQEVTPSDTKVKIKPDGLNSCKLLGNIDTVEPENVAAGVQENMSQVFDADPYAGIITIMGCGFGDLDEANLSDHIPNDNRVEFDATGIGIAANLEVTPFASDYLQWDDDIIRVRVPGIGYLIQNGVLIPDVFFGATATSGNVSVIAPGVEFVEEDAITVHFVHWNDFRGANMPDHESVRIRLKALDDYNDEVSGNPHNNDGIEFFFTQAFLMSMPAGSTQAVTDALEEWRCRTRVNFQIVDEADIEVPGFAGTIDYGSLDAGVFADTWEIIMNGLLDCEATNPVEDTPVIGHGIVFSDSDDVNFATNGMDVPDVESVAVHEFGHNVVLGHVDLNNYVMHPVVLDIDTDLAGGDISGGQHVVNVSTVDIVCQANGNDFPLPGMVPLGPCMNSVEDVNSFENRASIFPNPSTSGLIISSEGVPIVEVNVFDGTGRGLFAESFDLSKQSIEINHDLPQGIYLLTIQFKDGLFLTKKIIVAK